MLTQADLPLLLWLGGPGRPVRAVCDPSSVHTGGWGVKGGGANYAPSLLLLPFVSINSNLGIVCIFPENLCRDILRSFISYVNLLTEILF